MSACCNEVGCRRARPMMLMRSDLTGTWYVVTDYQDLGDGHYCAKAKHRLPDNTQEQLESMRTEAALFRGKCINVLHDRQDCSEAVLAGEIDAADMCVVCAAATKRALEE